jgi:hypothetical protein
MVAALREVAAGHVKIVPDIQVGAGGGVLDGLGALLMRALADDHAGDATNGSGAAAEEASPAPRQLPSAQEAHPVDAESPPVEQD